MGVRRGALVIIICAESESKRYKPLLPPNRSYNRRLFYSNRITLRQLLEMNRAARAGKHQAGKRRLR